MTIQKGICTECSKEYEYEYNPQFPRKYCHECSAAKKASYSAGDVPKQQTSTAQPVNAPVVKIPTANQHTTMYVSYAKDIFCTLWESKFYPDIPKNDDAVENTMAVSINLVKQAKKAFE